jgi:site-specific DNA-methyltransferase (adenine-specific)
MTSTLPYYEDDLVTLFNCDYRDGDLASLNADAIVTDPPYGETSLQWDVWVDGWLTDASAIARNLWCFGSFRMFHDHHDEFAEWKLAQDTVWEKQNGSGFHTDRFKRVHEHAVQWYLGEWKSLYNNPPKTQDAVKKTVSRQFKPSHMNQIGRSQFASERGGDRLMRSVIKHRNMHGRAINKTEKPVPLVSLYVEASVPPGGLVVDLFAGSCSTGLAARQQGKRAVLFEKDPEQCVTAARRLERETAQPFDLGALA